MAYISAEPEKKQHMRTAEMTLMAYAVSGHRPAANYRIIAMILMLRCKTETKPFFWGKSSFQFLKHRKQINIMRDKQAQFQAHTRRASDLKNSGAY